MSGTSSANPQKLSTYASDGLEMIGELRPKATEVVEAVQALGSSGSRHVPSLGDAHTRFADLVGDWQHLDEFAGDVANAFYNANNLGETPTPTDMVFTLSDSTIMTSGHVGYADRDIAIAEAERLAQDMQGTMEDGRISQEEMERFSDRATRGMYDSAFSVSFAETMGPDGMTEIPVMIERAWPDGDRGRNQGWGQEQLLPFATVLTTAMDTRARNEQIDLQDPDNENLADEDRLSEEWVDDFVDFSQPDQFEQPSDLHFSLMVKYADLPTDVLVDIGNNQVSDMLAYDATPTPYMNSVPWGIEDSTAEINVLDAIGENQDASLEWLGSTPDGRTANNMELVLRYNPTIGYGTDNPMLSGALDTVVDNGLQHWDDDKSDALFETVIETVADEGAVHFDEFNATLGEGARTHIDQLAERAEQVPGGRPGEVDENRLSPLYEAHDFLKVIMENDDAATSVYQGSLEYVRDQLSGDTGDGLGSEARSIGELMGLVTEADENAAVEATNQRIAARQSFLNGVGLVKDAVGLVPMGKGATTAFDVSTTLLDQAIDNFGEAGLPSVDQDYANIENVRDSLRGSITEAFGVYEYATNTEMTSSQVHQQTLDALGDRAEGMDTDFFVDGTSGDRRPIKPLAEMSDDERAAYEEWMFGSEHQDSYAHDVDVVGGRMRDVQDSLEHR